MGNVWHVGCYKACKKSLGLALPSQPQVGLKIQKNLQQANFSVDHFVQPVNDVIHIQMTLGRKKVPTPGETVT